MNLILSDLVSIFSAATVRYHQRLQLMLIILACAIGWAQRAWIAVAMIGDDRFAVRSQVNVLRLRLCLNRYE